MMYHKIPTIYKRDPDNNFKTLLHGQYVTDELAYLQNAQWVFTEKVDGTNIRVAWGGCSKRVVFGGKTDNAQLHSGLVHHLSQVFTTDKLDKQFGDTVVTLYGEGFGAKIHSGGKYRPDQGFVLFDVRVDGWWLKREDVEDIAVSLGTDVVPVVGRGTLPEMVEIARAGFNSHWGLFIAEGIVARPAVELFDGGGRRIITKVKHKDFAAKEEMK